MLGEAADEEDFGEIAQDMENCMTQMRNAYNSITMLNKDVRAKKATPEMMSEMYCLMTKERQSEGVRKEREDCDRARAKTAIDGSERKRKNQKN